MTNVTIISCGPEGLGSIQPLWEQLNHHHAETSAHFSDYFENFTFEQRSAALKAKARRGKLRLFIAESDGQIAGQCIVSLMPELLGEIDSIFVGEAFRGKKIGDSLMRAALDWLDENGAKSKTVVVVYGNESAHAFYERYGFKPRSTRLAQR